MGFASGLAGRDDAHGYMFTWESYMYQNRATAGMLHQSVHMCGAATHPTTLPFRLGNGPRASKVAIAFNTLLDTIANNTRSRCVCRGAHSEHPAA